MRLSPAEGFACWQCMMFTGSRAILPTQRGTAQARALEMDPIPYQGESVSVSPLQHLCGIGVNDVGDRADSMNDPDMLRLENLDTDIPPPTIANAATQQAVGADAANS